MFLWDILGCVDCIVLIREMRLISQGFESQTKDNKNHDEAYYVNFTFAQ